MVPMLPTFYMVCGDMALPHLLLSAQDAAILREHAKQKHHVLVHRLTADSASPSKAAVAQASYQCQVSRMLSDGETALQRAVARLRCIAAGFTSEMHTPNAGADVLRTAATPPPASHHAATTDGVQVFDRFSKRGDKGDVQLLSAIDLTKQPMLHLKQWALDLCAIATAARQANLVLLAAPPSERARAAARRAVADNSLAAWSQRASLWLTVTCRC